MVCYYIRSTTVDRSFVFYYKNNLFVEDRPYKMMVYQNKHYSVENI